MSEIFKRRSKFSILGITRMLPAVIILMVLAFSCRKELSICEEEDFGIVVANFEGETREANRVGREFKNDFIDSLRTYTTDTTRFHSRICIVDYRKPVSNAKQAEQVGTDYHADILTYGIIRRKLNGNYCVVPKLYVANKQLIDRIQTAQLVKRGYILGHESPALIEMLIVTPICLCKLTEVLILLDEKRYKDAEVKLDSIVNIPNIIGHGVREHFRGYLYFVQAMADTTDTLKCDTLLQKSQGAYSESLKKNPDYHNSYFCLGCIFVVKKQPDSALVYFQKAFVLEPSKFEYNWNYAQALRETQQHGRAKGVLEAYLTRTQVIPSDERKQIKDRIDEIDTEIEKIRSNMGV